MKKTIAFIAAMIIAIISYADGEGVVPISVQDATSQSDPVHRSLIPSFQLRHITSPSILPFALHSPRTSEIWMLRLLI